MVRAIWGSENEKWLLDGGGDIDSGDFNKKKEDDGISRCCFSPAGKKDQLQICRDFYLAFIQSILRAKNNWTLVESLIFALAQCGKEHLCELPQKREKSQYYCVDILWGYVISSFSSIKLVQSIVSHATRPPLTWRAGENWSHLK